MERELIRHEIDFYELRRALESFLENHKDVTDYWGDKPSSDMLKFVKIQIITSLQQYQNLIHRMNKCYENTI